MHQDYYQFDSRLDWLPGFFLIKNILDEVSLEEFDVWAA